jgi:hypothetical protein
MFNLSDIFKKTGVTGIDDLKPAERATFDQWTAILTKPETTIDDLKKLLPKELERANHELQSFDNSDKKDMFYKAYTKLLEDITKIILTPEKEREQLKLMLQQKYGLE